MKWQTQYGTEKAHVRVAGSVALGSRPKSAASGANLAACTPALVAKAFRGNRESAAVDRLRGAWYSPCRVVRQQPGQLVEPECAGDCPMPGR